MSGVVADAEVMAQTTSSLPGVVRRWSSGTGSTPTVSTSAPTRRSHEPEPLPERLPGPEPVPWPVPVVVTSRSAPRGPGTDAGDPLDGVAGDVAGAPRRGELGVGGEVDLGQPIEQVPGVVARLHHRVGVQHRVGVEENARLVRRLDGKDDSGIPLDVAELQMVAHVAADQLVAVQTDPDDADLRAAVGIDGAEVGERAGLDEVAQVGVERRHRWDPPSTLGPVSEGALHFYPGQGGVRLAYRDIGSGRPLVLLHGLSTDGRMWIRPGHAERFGAAGFRTIIPDFRVTARATSP